MHRSIVNSATPTMDLRSRGLALCAWNEAKKAGKTTAGSLPPSRSAPVCSWCRLARELQTDVCHETFGVLALCGPCSATWQLHTVGTQARSPATQEVFVNHVRSTADVLGRAVAAEDQSSYWPLPSRSASSNKRTHAMVGDQDAEDTAKARRDKLD